MKEKQKHTKPKPAYVEMPANSKLQRQGKDERPHVSRSFPPYLNCIIVPIPNICAFSCTTADTRFWEDTTAQYFFLILTLFLSGTSSVFFYVPHHFWFYRYVALAEPAPANKFENFHTYCKNFLNQRVDTNVW